ncbi:MAG: PQQ-dependent dehydrogenase, methanol/ethanol family [Gammaproteobacteria bacterium]|jgi:PQQ-dependent dehydrogenase (methanol/ethanol family)|nr:PQQ-dependent dehydrogenase, methanol/ethanol family [Gammaproteobacteria bacterium]|tara:strand:+ start:8481 stop:10631 length:2151 start_codon:yes stop_codon:yes gene_type:complete
MKPTLFILIRRVYLLMLCSLVLTACDTQQEERTTAPKESEKRSVPNVEWTMYGNDFGEQRYSTLTQINHDNISSLELTWYFDLYTKRGVEATPLIVDGVMFVSGSWSMVYALDATTGSLKWFYDPEVDRAFLAKACCDAVNRGVAYHEGKIFVGSLDGRLISLSAADGKVLFDVQTTDRDQSYTITGAPRIASDKVIIGNGGADLGVRGYVSAYHVDTGEMAWRFYTVPGNPADGFENETMAMAAKTWTGEWWKWGGGGTAWDSIVYDPELDLLYIGVGNGSPRNQQMRSPGGGDNLFLASIVALKPDTGEYVWHYQTTPGETWDFTATQPMMLAELDIGGEQRKVLMQAPKNGFFYVLDRVTGELISAKPYTQVNWATEIDIETGRPIENPKARDFDNPIPVMPFMGGGHNWAPMSYNPKTGLIYFGEMSVPQSYATPVLDIDREPGHGYWNTGFNSLAAAPPPMDDVDEFMASIAKGKLVAWDPVRQEARWEYDHQRTSNSGTLSTAGMLVFQGDSFTNFNAFNAESGELLWSREAQTAVMAAPVTYAINGEQYVAVAAGWGGGGAHEAGALTHGWNARNKSRVLVYKLGGQQQLPALSLEEETPMSEPLPVTASAEIIAEGQVLYEKHCSACHGGGLRTGGINPDLRRSSPAIHKTWQDIVIGGLLQPLGMVSFSQFMSSDDAEAVRQYVLGEANRQYTKQQASQGEAAPPEA